MYSTQEAKAYTEKINKTVRHGLNKAKELYSNAGEKNLSLYNQQL